MPARRSGCGFGRADAGLQVWSITGGSRYKISAAPFFLRDPLTMWPPCITIEQANFAEARSEG